MERLFLGGVGGFHSEACRASGLNSAGFRGDRRSILELFREVKRKSQRRYVSLAVGGACAEPLSLTTPPAINRTLRKASRAALAAHVFGRVSDTPAIRKPYSCKHTSVRGPYAICSNALTDCSLPRVCHHKKRGGACGPPLTPRMGR